MADDKMIEMKGIEANGDTNVSPSAPPVDSSSVDMVKPTGVAIPRDVRKMTKCHWIAMFLNILLPVPFGFIPLIFFAFAHVEDVHGCQRKATGFVKLAVILFVFNTVASCILYIVLIILGPGLGVLFFIGKIFSYLFCV